MSGRNNQTYSLDPLVATTILLFSDYSDWPVIQPYLISKTFHHVFESQRFSKQYLIKLFQLDSNEQKRLEECLEIHHQFIETESSFKRRKIEHEMTYHKILQLYVTKSYCSVETQMPSLLNQYLIADKYSIERSCIERRMKHVLSRLNKTRKLCRAFSQFFSNEEWVVSYSTFTLSRATLWKLFGACQFPQHAASYELIPTRRTQLSHAELNAPFKAVFIDDFKDTNEILSEYTVFTSCGFPLSVQITYHSTVPLHDGTGESCIVNGQQLFSHEMSDKGVSFSEYSEECLNYVKSILFGSYTHQEDALTLNTLLYNVLRLGLFKYSHSYESCVRGDSKALPTFNNRIFSNQEEEDEEQDEEDEEEEQDEEQ
ncbi:hypothetical protein C9374_010020 [Naegleria lovaniensis]|uniref:Uncharacterized protein n=1 Tax=Naegleria lovaniensis TaxID=51637 RepID=A0AA88KJZ6_NAELO|nr:uncharacterized protein C9374_010020 [Naegleria lovaniensis]KAG2375397.1 hypothetical protein C9374_010020 [Naegleria lovaniensis]